ncbi:hypothetical protein C1H76_1730 [Elsinoe australis]|uniref:Uncharacterized protein n=1 Tax=Elsinoe australis TaxID=40998 RepID=A0A4U7BA83_9PEZI|nr:hypothetical protein C1H76_1730 [Elsinoe australis]
MSDTNDKNTGPGSLNTMESKLIISILANMQGTLSVNWDEVAAMSGYSNEASARAQFGRLKRTKIAPFAAGGAKDGPASKAAPKKRGKKATETSGEDGEAAADELGDEEYGTKAKGKRGRAAKKPKVDVGVQVKDEDAADDAEE